MFLVLLLSILSLVLTTTTVHLEGNCPTIQGQPGRDGRDGTPGRDGIPGMDGAAGPPTTLSYIELATFLSDIEEYAQASASSIEVNKRTCSSSCSEFLGRNSTIPANSCLHLYQCNVLSSSGLYWIVGSNTTSKQVYCDMDNARCGSKGWTRIAYLNMAEDGATCPSGLTVITDPKNLCGRGDGSAASCSSLTYSVYGTKYNRVCGRAIGYQFGSTDGYHGPQDINSYYVDGLSITYGSPRKHIWTYASGVSDNTDGGGRYTCPCALYPGFAPPSFVGDNQYCESGNVGGFTGVVYDDDPLWDGDGCGEGNNCCAQPGMPWFCRSLPLEIEDDIEVRFCGNEGAEDVYVELLELYIQ